MQVTLTNETGDQLRVVEISTSMTVADLKALAEVEFNIPSAHQALTHNGLLLSDNSKTMSQVNVRSDDIILVTRLGGQTPLANSSDPIESARLRILSDPQLLRTLELQNPQVAQAARDPILFRQLMEQVERQRRSQQFADEADLNDADPFDVEAQRKIEEAIRKENITRNMENAMEHHPESFAQVTMLYIDMEVNGIPVKAFVDSGAQATIMSPEYAEKCKIMHLLDVRFAGIAEGVGTAKILGRVHSAQIKIGTQFLACSFTIMEGKGVDLLFGLDMLKRYLACIDLEKNCLRINNQEIKFLAEHELPDKAKRKISGANDSKETDAKVTSSNQTHAAPTVSSPTKSTTVTSSSSSSGQVAGSAQGSKYPEAVIQQLMALGVSRVEVIAALDQCGGNPEMAANLFF